MQLMNSPALRILDIVGLLQDLSHETEHLGIVRLNGVILVKQVFDTLELIGFHQSEN